AVPSRLLLPCPRHRLVAVRPALWTGRLAASAGAAGMAGPHRLPQVRQAARGHARHLRALRGTACRARTRWHGDLRGYRCAATCGSDALTSARQGNRLLRSPGRLVMRVLIWKECRENFKWAIVPILLFAGCMAILGPPSLMDYGALLF